MKTRAALGIALSCGVLLASLLTSFVQCDNHARAQLLATRQREWEMLSAANAQMRAVATSHVFGVDNRELDVVSKAARERRGKGAQ
ncbi:MAG: hypothetical protein IT454_22140 [Planctomycetes bacterium]|nr:hypothetical protein [Planctomycetota bacterium]